jgi:hypothetical protein
MMETLNTKTTSFVHRLMVVSNDDDGHSKRSMYYCKVTAALLLQKGM